MGGAANGMPRKVRIPLFSITPSTTPSNCLDSLRTPGACRQGRGEQDGHGPDRVLSHCCRLPAATSRDVLTPGDEPRQGDSGAAHRMVDAPSNRRNGCASPGGSGAQSRDREVGTTSSTFQLRSGRSPYQSRVGRFSPLFRKSQSTIRRNFDLVLAGWLSRSPDVFARFGVIDRSRSHRLNQVSRIEGYGRPLVLVRSLSRARMQDARRGHHRRSAPP